MGNMCTFEGTTAACNGRIQYSATHLVSNSSNSCDSAHRLVMSQCPHCKACTLAAAKCKAPQLPQEMFNSAPQDRSSLTDRKKSKSMGCNSMCMFEGRSASCNARINYAAKHLVSDKPNPCKAALFLVHVQCPSCHVCNIKDSACNSSSEARGDKH